MRTLRAEALCKAYRNRTVVRGVDLEVRQGEIVGLLGPNGAGKTTSFYMIVGLTRPDAGRVLLDDEEITTLPMYLRARKGINYLPPEPSVFRKLSVAANIMAVLENMPYTKAQRVEVLGHLLADLGLAHLAARKSHSLSGGERRRVEIG